MFFGCHSAANGSYLENIEVMGIKLQTSSFLCLPAISMFILLEVEGFG